MGLLTAEIIRRRTGREVGIPWEFDQQVRVRDWGRHFTSPSRGLAISRLADQTCGRLRDRRSDPGVLLRLAGGAFRSFVCGVLIRDEWRVGRGCRCRCGGRGGPDRRDPVQRCSDHPSCQHRSRYGGGGGCPTNSVHFVVSSGLNRSSSVVTESDGEDSLPHVRRLGVCREGAEPASC